MTWTVAVAALLAACAGLGVAMGHVPNPGQTGFLSMTEAFSAPRDVKLNEAQYLIAQAAHEPPAVEAALDAAQAHLVHLRPAAYLSGVQEGSPDLVLCFEMKDQPDLPGGHCRARCVVLRINGQPVRGGAGQLIQADLSQNGPLLAAGWDDAAMTVNNSPNAMVRLPTGVARPGDTLNVDWALVLVGTDDVTYRVGRHQHDVVVGPRVEIPRITKGVRP